jgi:polyhydroxyalkanoate synthesis regulator phasin
MSNAKKWTAVAGAAMAVVMLLAGALPAAADTTVAAPTAHRGGPMGGGVNDTYLAEALGITAVELQTAQQAANEAAIDQALALGLITQAQADALKQRSGMLGRGGRGFHGFFGAGDRAIDMDALLAEALGITADELAAARVEAQELALAAAVESGRITQEQADQMKARQALQAYMDEQGFRDQVRTLVEGIVQQAVQAGVLTQEQADAILSNSGRFGGMRGFDGFHGRGMRMPGMRGLQSPAVTGTGL